MSIDLSSDLTAQSIVWRPRPSQIERSRMLAFGRRHGIEDYDGLVQRAADDPEWFWGAVCEELDIVWTAEPSRILDTSRGIEWPHWFVDGRMNYVTSAVDRHLTTRGDEIAIQWEGDDGSTENLTFVELSAAINRLCNALTRLGIGKGSRVGIFLPMLAETAIAMLACGKLGAVFVPIFSGFGADAAAERMRDAEVELLITADGMHRRGKVIAMKGTADRAADLVDTVTTVVVVRNTGEEIPWDPERDHWWHDIVTGESAEFDAADTSASDPYMIIYTSGTTGKPKGAVHVHAGFPIKAAQDLAFNFDFQTGDVLCWLTDLGWMMGPWAISGGLLAGGTVMLYEGTPDYPHPDRVWRIVERHGVNVLGVSPTAIRALMSKGDEWVDAHPMETLRAIGSTGEPWNPGPWMWTLEKVGRQRCPIINYSGGTEIGGGIVGSTTIHPLKPASFTGPIPGVPADVVDAQGRSVRGEVGELVIRGPWVGMTNGFLNDPDRYLETYWSQIPGVWTHGDWAYVDNDGFWYILGRSDDTLNVAGKRVGPAEIESATVAHPAVQEAAAIGIPHEVKGEAIVVFVILTEGTEFTAELAEEIRATVGDHLGRPLMPEKVVPVQDLPRTRNAKIMRRVIRSKYLGRADLGDLSALENPEAVAAISPGV